MQKHKVLKIGSIIIGLLSIAGVVIAAPYFNYTRTMVPETDDNYDLGTTTLRYRNLYLSGTCTGCGGGFGQDWKLLLGVLTPTTTVPVSVPASFFASTSILAGNNITGSNLFATSTATSTIAGKFGVGTTTIQNNSSITLGSSTLSALFQNRLTGKWGIGTTSPTSLFSILGKQTIFTNNSAAVTSTGMPSHLELGNDTGTVSQMGFRFGSNLRSAIEAGSNGDMNFYFTGANGFTARTLPSTQWMFAAPAGLGMQSGYISGSTGVLAGSTGQPTSMFQNLGTTGLQPTLITTTGTTLSGNYTEVLCDGTNAGVCTGTPTNPCAGSANQTACELYSRGCTWNPGSSCSAFDNESGMTTCAGTSGCTVQTTSCSGAGDSTTCTNQNTAYGGSCSWIDCGALSDGGGDGTNCATQPSCTYDSGTGICSGDNCAGTYNNGSCTGTYGANCSGTATCSSISQANCTTAGCSYTPGLNLTMPASPPNGRIYSITNVSTTSAACIINGNTGQSVDTASSTKLENYKDSTFLEYYERTTSCSDYSTSESLCGSFGDCTQNYSFCAYDTGSTICSGDSGSVCSAHNGNQSGCEAQQYFSSCSGTHSVSKNWYVPANRTASTTFYSFIKAPYFVATTTRASVFPYASTTMLTAASSIAFIGYSATPQLYAADSTTGIHFDGPSIVSIHNGGQQTMLLSSTNRVGIASSSPFSRLSVHGITSLPYISSLFSVGSSTASATTTLFTVNANGRIGIGTSSPATTLQITKGLATTTVTVGELGGAGCVNMVKPDGTMASYFINNANVMITEASACK